MTAPGLDERAHAKALAALIDAHLGPNDVYEYGKVPGVDGNPGKEPSIYVLIQVTRRYLPATRSVRQASRSGWRASVRAVGRTVDECRWASLRVSEALDGAYLTISALPSTPVQHETSDEPDKDGGRWSSLSRWTYAL